MLKKKGLAELKAKKRTEEIAKEVAEKQKKIEEERALRKAEELKEKKLNKEQRKLH